MAETDVTFGFDTALGIATEAIDRLHSTAHSHHRIIVVEIMGHRAGWLALGAGIAGGADVILIPEIPYDINVVGGRSCDRTAQGKRFTIVAVAEGAMSVEEAEVMRRRSGRRRPRKGQKEAEAVLELESRARGAHHAPGHATGATHRTRSRGSPSWATCSGRHALRGRPPDRHAAGQRLCRSDPGRGLRRHGRGAGQGTEPVPWRKSRASPSRPTRPSRVLSARRVGHRAWAM